MATVEVEIPSDLGLTEKQMRDLEESFKKQIVDTLKGKPKAQKASPQLMAVEVRAKSKSEVV